MAIYYLEVKVGSRGKGQSAIASAAYRAGAKLKDEEIRKTFDYTKKGGVVHSEISLCSNAPEEYAEREILWNAVHKVEKASNSRLFREILVAIPNELQRDEQIQLVREYVRGLTDRGMCCDWNIHDKGDGNPHAHIMCTVRSITEKGTWAAKSRKQYVLDESGNKIPLENKDKNGRTQYKSYKIDYNNWNETERVEEWRAEWAACCNKYLSPEQKIDHRSYQRQGKEIIPQIHEGYASRKREQMGLTSDRCEYNRQVKEDNQRLRAFDLVLQSYQKDIDRLKSVAEYDVQQLITLRDEYIRQVYISNKVKYGHFKTDKHDDFKLAKKNWEEFQDCVRAVQQANQEYEKIFSLTSKRKRKENKKQAVENLKTAKNFLQDYIHIEIGYEYLLRDFDCNTPTESNFTLLSGYVEKKLAYLEQQAKYEYQDNVRLQKYMDMNITPESISAALRAFSDACQSIPEAKRQDAAHLLDENPIPIYLDDKVAYFPKVVPVVREKISQVLKKYNLVSKPLSDQLDSTEPLEQKQPKQEQQRGEVEEEIVLTQTAHRKKKFRGR